MELDDTVSKIRNREKEWDILKGFLMISVVISHLDFGNGVRHYIYAFHMPLFFLISGYFYHPSTEGYGGVRKRFKSLIEPYFFIILVNYIFWIILYSPANVLSPIVNIFWANTVDGIPIAGALWFLTSLFFVYLIAYFLDKIADDRRRIFAIVSLAIIGALFRFVPFRLPLGLDCAIEGTAFFEIGYFMQRKRTLAFLIQSGKCKIIFLSIASLIISIPLIFVNGVVNFRDLKFAILPLTFINVLLSLTAYLGLSRLISISRYKWIKCIQYELQFVGRNTMVFLGFHQLARWFVIRIVNRLIFMNFFGFSIVRGFCYVTGCIVACQILVYILNKINPIRKMLHIIV